MKNKHYLIEARVSKVWDELLAQKEALREERNGALQELAKQILLDEVLGEINKERLENVKLHMYDINKRASELKNVMMYIQQGDYSEIETIFNDAMNEFDKYFVFANEF